MLSYCSVIWEKTRLDADAVRTFSAIIRGPVVPRRTPLPASRRSSRDRRPGVRVEGEAHADAFDAATSPLMPAHG